MALVRYEPDAMVAEVVLAAPPLNLFSAALIDDLEAALAREGYEPDRPLVEELRRRFSAS